MIHIAALWLTHSKRRQLRHAHVAYLMPRDSIIVFLTL